MIHKNLNYFENNYNLHGYDYVNNHYYEHVSPNNNGAALTFWGEHAQGMSQKELLKQELPLIKCFLQQK